MKQSCSLKPLHSLGQPFAYISDAQTLQNTAASERDAVLLIHGYTGLCSSFRFLAEQLYAAGYDVICPRMPGHGCSGREFRNSNARQWLHAAQDCYREWCDRYRQLHLVGLSMGGCIAAILATRLPSNKLGKLVLMAPALDVFNKLLYLTPYLRFFGLRIVNHGSADYDSYQLHGPNQKEQQELDQIQQEYWRYNYAKMAAELLKLLRLGRKSLAHIQCPVLLQLGQRDRSVPFSIKQRIERSVKSELLHSKIYPDSNHILPNYRQRQEVAQDVIEFLKRPQ